MHAISASGSARCCPVGVSQGSVSHYEKGRIEIPLGVLLAACRILDVAPAEIVPGLEHGGQMEMKAS